MNPYFSWRFDSTIGLPGNNQYAILYDSTANFEASRYTAVSALPAPAASSGRGRMKGLRITGGVTPITQGITLQFYSRVGDAGTNADWALDTTVSGTSSTGAVAVAAGASQQVSWAPNYPDVLILALAGATAPSDIDAWFQLVPAARTG